MDSVERGSLTKVAVNALHTRLKVVNNIPKKLWILWSKALAKALLALAESKTETEARIATERYFKLKGALVMPLRSGKSHRSHTAVFFFSRESKKCP